MKTELYNRKRLTKTAPLYSSLLSYPRFSKSQSSKSESHAEPSKAIAESSTKGRTSKRWQKEWCDKIWLQYPFKPSIDGISPHKIIKSPSFRRPYRFDKNAAMLFRFSDRVQIAIYLNEWQCEIQLNPTQFDSCEAMIELLNTVTDGRALEGLITRLDLSVKLPYSIEDVARSMKVKRLSKSMTFMDSRRVKKGGRLIEVGFTTKLGSPSRKAFSIYDSHVKHGDPVNTTKIEVQYRARPVMPVPALGELIERTDLVPFNAIEFFDFKATTKLSDRDSERLDRFQLRLERDGLQKTIAYLRGKDPKHFYERYARVLNFLKPKDIRLDEMFQKRMNKFVTAKPSVFERSLLKSIRRF